MLLTNVSFLSARRWLGQMSRSCPLSVPKKEGGRVDFETGTELRASSFPRSLSI